MRRSATARARCGKAVFASPYCCGAGDLAGQQDVRAGGDYHGFDGDNSRGHGYLEPGESSARRNRPAAELERTVVSCRTAAVLAKEASDGTAGCARRTLEAAPGRRQFLSVRCGPRRG